jgi:hypothetical protein
LLMPITQASFPHSSSQCRRMAQPSFFLIGSKGHDPLSSGSLRGKFSVNHS